MYVLIFAALILGWAGLAVADGQTYVVGRFIDQHVASDMPYSLAHSARSTAINLAGIIQIVVTMALGLGLYLALPA